jgi:multimeric flavodoxin WrbA
LVKVLGLAGSPRRGGKAERLLDAFLAGADDAGAAVEKVDLTMLPMDSCVGCPACAADGAAELDPEIEEVCAKIRAADVVALASPVFINSLNPRMVELLDRFRGYWGFRERITGRRDAASDDEASGAGRGVVLTVGDDDFHDLPPALESQAAGIFRSFGKHLSGCVVFARDRQGREEARTEDEAYAARLGERFVREPAFQITTQASASA